MECKKSLGGYTFILVIIKTSKMSSRMIKMSSRMIKKSLSFHKAHQAFIRLSSGLHHLKQPQGSCRPLPTQRGSGDESTHVLQEGIFTSVQSWRQKASHLPTSRRLTWHQSLITIKLEEKAPWYQDQSIVPY